MTAMATLLYRTNLFVKRHHYHISNQSWRTLTTRTRTRSHTDNARIHDDAARNDGSSVDQSPIVFPHMFAPLDLGPDIGVLPNRVLMGSMHTGLEGHSIPRFVAPFLGAEVKHDDLSAMAEYFAERAKGGCGLMVTGGIAPNIEGWVGPFAAKLTTKTEMDQHKLVTDAVHAVNIPMRVLNGTASAVPARICLQILHTGRYAYHPLAVSASATKSPISPFTARALKTTEVRQTITDFVRCAILAKEAGYDGVEVMGSEGYLISQFLCSSTNIVSTQ